MPNNNRKNKKMLYKTISGVLLSNVVVSSTIQAAGSDKQKTKKKTNTKTKPLSLKKKRNFLKVILEAIKKFIGGEHSSKISDEKILMELAKIDAVSPENSNIDNVKEKGNKDDEENKEDIKLNNKEFSEVALKIISKITDSENKENIEIGKAEALDNVKIVTNAKEEDKKVEETKAFFFQDEGKNETPENHSLLEVLNPQIVSNKIKKKPTKPVFWQNEVDKVNDEDTKKEKNIEKMEEDTQNNFLEVGKKGNDLGEESVHREVLEEKKSENKVVAERKISDLDEKNGEILENADVLSHKGKSLNEIENLHNENLSAEERVELLKKQWFDMLFSRRSAILELKFLDDSKISDTKKEISSKKWRINICKNKIKESEESLANIIKEIPLAEKEKEEAWKKYVDKYYELHKKKNAGFREAIDKALDHYNKLEDFLRGTYYSPKVIEIFKKLNSISSEKEYDDEISRIIGTIIKEINEANKKRRGLSKESKFYYYIGIVDYKKVFCDVMDGKADKVIKDDIFSISTDEFFFETCDNRDKSRKLEELQENKKKIEEEISDYKKELSMMKSELFELNMKLHDLMVEYIVESSKLETIEKNILEKEEEAKRVSKKTGWDWFYRKMFVEDYFKGFDLFEEDNKRYLQTVPEKASQYRIYIDNMTSATGVFV